tara:strand:+ start:71 stop:1345 length:1275 start_codon:yes stop_codon:yes gene_type:complete
MNQRIRFDNGVLIVQDNTVRLGLGTRKDNDMACVERDFHETHTLVGTMVVPKASLEVKYSVRPEFYGQERNPYFFIEVFFKPVKHYEDYVLKKLEDSFSKQLDNPDLSFKDYKKLVRKYNNKKKQNVFFNLEKSFVETIDEKQRAHDIDLNNFICESGRHYDKNVSVKIFASSQKYLKDALLVVQAEAKDNPAIDYVDFSPCPTCCNKPVGCCDGTGCGCLYALDNEVKKGTSLCREPPVQVRNVPDAKAWHVDDKAGLTNETWLSAYDQSLSAAWVVHDEDKALLAKLRMAAAKHKLAGRNRSIYEIAGVEHVDDEALFAQAAAAGNRSIYKIAQPATHTMVCYVNDAAPPPLYVLLYKFWLGDTRIDNIVFKNQHVIVRKDNVMQKYGTLEKRLQRVRLLERKSRSQSGRHRKAHVSIKPDD